MSDLVVNFDLFGGLSENEWSDKIDVEYEIRNKRHSEVNEEELLKLEKGRNEPGTVKQTGWAVRCFLNWCEEKGVNIDLKIADKEETNAVLRLFYATVKNSKGEPYGLSTYQR